jgi:hypothetical protein
MEKAGFAEVRWAGNTGVKTSAYTTGALFTAVRS